MILSGYFKVVCFNAVFQRHHCLNRTATKEANERETEREADRDRVTENIFTLYVCKNIFYVIVCYESYEVNQT